jgi:hypothetical protein
MRLQGWIAASDVLFVCDLANSDTTTSSALSCWPTCFANIFDKAVDIAERTSGPAFVAFENVRANAVRTRHVAGKRESAGDMVELPRLPPPTQHAIGASIAREYCERPPRRRGPPRVGSAASRNRRA